MSIHVYFSVGYTRVYLMKQVTSLPFLKICIEVTVEVMGEPTFQKTSHSIHLQTWGRGRVTR